MITGQLNTGAFRRSWADTNWAKRVQCVLDLNSPGGRKHDSKWTMLLLYDWSYPPHHLFSACSAAVNWHSDKMFSNLMNRKSMLTLLWSCFSQLSCRPPADSPLLTRRSLRLERKCPAVEAFLDTCILIWQPSTNVPAEWRAEMAQSPRSPFSRCPMMVRRSLICCVSVCPRW